jgi:hypothetical protein
MSLIIPNPYRHYPTEWSKYNGNHSAYMTSPQFMRPTATYRFGARFRAANAYTGSKFSGYSSRETARGYTALVAFTLAFSAFEYFYKEVLELDVPELDKLLWSKHRKKMDWYQLEFENLVQSPETDALFKAIRPHVDSRHQKSIDEMVSGTDVILIRVLAAIRHAFVHGHLTPNMGKLPPDTVTELCKFGYNFLMDVMDREFSRRINYRP